MSMDPVAKYVLLDDDISKGILAWLSIGIDPNAVHQGVSPTVFMAENGGFVNSDAETGPPGGPGGPPLNGTFPTHVPTTQPSLLIPLSALLLLRPRLKSSPPRQS